MTAIDAPSAQLSYHGTKADLKQGDLIGPGYASNYGKKKKATYVYLTATLDAAIWGAELAQDQKGQAGFTSWRRPARLKTIPT